MLEVSMLSGLFKNIMVFQGNLFMNIGNKIQIQVNFANEVTLLRGTSNAGSSNKKPKDSV